MKQISYWFGLFFIYIPLMLCFAGVLLFGSCGSVKPQYIPMPKDSIVYRNSIDSVFVYKADSVVIYSQGDTVFKDRWHTLLKDRFKTDTLRVGVKEPYPVEVPVPVEKELNWWQRFTGVVGNLFLVAIVAWASWKIRNLFK